MEPILTLDQLRATVRSERQRRGMTQAHAAALLGYSQKWLSEFESGKVDPPTSMVIRLTALLGIPLQTTPRFEPPSSEDEIETDIDLEMRFP